MQKKLYFYCYLFIIPFIVNSQDIVRNTSRVPERNIHFVNAEVASNFISASDVLNYRGKAINLCGKVYEARITNDGHNQHLNIKINGSYINERLDVNLIFTDNVHLPENYDKNLLMKSICITGTVTDNFEAPEVYVQSYEVHEHEPENDNSIESYEGKEFKIINKAYLLSGPKWKEDVITHLPEGSIVIIEELQRGWTFVRVKEQIGNDIDNKPVYGYINNNAIGLTKQGKLF